MPETLKMALQLRSREKRILQQTVSFSARRKQMVKERTEANGQAES
jgi:hypothetical protein